MIKFNFFDNKNIGNKVFNNIRFNPIQNNINFNPLQNNNIQFNKIISFKQPIQIFKDTQSDNSVPLKDARFVTLYHGTSKQNVPSILKEGLQPRQLKRDWNKPFSLSLSPSPGRAIIHAELMGSENDYMDKRDELGEKYKGEEYRQKLKELNESAKQNAALLKVTIPIKQVKHHEMGDQTRFLTHDRETIKDDYEVKIDSVIKPEHIKEIPITPKLKHESNIQYIKRERNEPKEIEATQILFKDINSNDNIVEYIDDEIKGTTNDIKGPMPVWLMQHLRRLKRKKEEAEIEQQENIQSANLKFPVDEEAEKKRKQKKIDDDVYSDENIIDNTKIINDNVTKNATFNDLSSKIDAAEELFGKRWDDLNAKQRKEVKNHLDNIDIEDGRRPSKSNACLYCSIGSVDSNNICNNPSCRKFELPIQHATSKEEKNMAWDLESPKKDKRYIRYMHPLRYLAMTQGLGVTKDNKIIIPDYLTYYTNTETKKVENIKKLGEKIVDKKSSVNIPYVVSDSDQEGRHRSFAAFIAGKKRIPVKVIRPFSHRSPVIAEEFIKRAFPNEEDERTKEKWRNRFKDGKVEYLMDEENIDLYHDILREKGLDNNEVYDEEDVFDDVNPEDIIIAQPDTELDKELNKILNNTNYLPQKTYNEQKAKEIRKKQMEVGTEMLETVGDVLENPDAFQEQLKVLPKKDVDSEEKIIIPLSSNTKTLAPHGSVNVEQYGFDFDKTIVHGTSAQNAKIIQDTMRFKQGTGLTPGRGGMEDASMWATNTFKNDAVVMLAETKEPNVRQHKGAWIHAGTRAEEWKGDEYSAKYPEGIELEKVKVFKPVPLVFVEKGKDVHETFQLEEIESPEKKEEKNRKYKRCYFCNVPLVNGVCPQCGTTASKTDFYKELKPPTPRKTTLANMPQPPLAPGVHRDVHKKTVVIAPSGNEIIYNSSRALGYNAKQRLAEIIMKHNPDVTDEELSNDNVYNTYRKSIEKRREQINVKRVPTDFNRVNFMRGKIYEINPNIDPTLLRDDEVKKVYRQVIKERTNKNLENSDVSDLWNVIDNDVKKDIENNILHKKDVLTKWRKDNKEKVREINKKSKQEQKNDKNEIDTIAFDVIEDPTIVKFSAEDVNEQNIEEPKEGEEKDYRRSKRYIIGDKIVEIPTVIKAYKDLQIEENLPLGKSRPVLMKVGSGEYVYPNDKEYNDIFALYVMKNEEKKQKAYDEKLEDEEFNKMSSEEKTMYNKKKNEEYKKIFEEYKKSQIEEPKEGEVKDSNLRLAPVDSFQNKKFSAYVDEGNLNDIFLTSNMKNFGDDVNLHSAVISHEEDHLGLAREAGWEQSKALDVIRVPELLKTKNTPIIDHNTPRVEIMNTNTANQIIVNTSELRSRIENELKNINEDNYPNVSFSKKYRPPEEIATALINLRKRRIEDSRTDKLIGRTDRIEKERQEQLLKEEQNIEEPKEGEEKNKAQIFLSPRDDGDDEWYSEGTDFDVVAYHIGGEKDKTFLGAALKDVNFNNKKNINALSNILQHEEVHNILEEDMGMAKTSLAFDKIVIPTFLSNDNKNFSNPESLSDISIKNTSRINAVRGIAEDDNIIFDIEDEYAQESKIEEPKEGEEKNMAWDINKKVGTANWDYPEQQGYKGERKFVNSHELFKQLQKTGSANITSKDTELSWINKMNNSPGDLKFKHGDMEQLKLAILSEDKKIEPIMLEKKNDNTELYEGRHRLAAGLALDIDVPAVTIEKMNQREKDLSFIKRSHKEGKVNEKDYKLIKNRINEEYDKKDLENDDDSSNNISKQLENMSYDEAIKRVHTYYNYSDWKTQMNIKRFILGGQTFDNNEEPIALTIVSWKFDEEDKEGKSRIWEDITGKHLDTDEEVEQNE